MAREDAHALPSCEGGGDIPIAPEAVADLGRGIVEHIAEHWGFYRTHLPHVRHTLVVFDDLMAGVRHLPEASDPALWFNPKEFLIDEIPRAFRMFAGGFSPWIGDIVYGAWPQRLDLAWLGHFETEDKSPGGLMPESFASLKEALEFVRRLPKCPRDSWEVFFECGCYEVTVTDVPEAWYRGFKDVEEFPEQRDALDRVRLHPRVASGIAAMERKYAEQGRRVAERRDDLESALEVILARHGIPPMRDES